LVVESRTLPCNKLQLCHLQRYIIRNHVFNVTSCNLLSTQQPSIKSNLDKKHAHEFNQVMHCMFQSWNAHIWLLLDENNYVLNMSSTESYILICNAVVKAAV
jgi:hypothetical protein